MKNKIFVALSTFAENGNEPIEILKSSKIDYFINSLGRRITADEILKMSSDATGIIAGVEPYTRDVLSNLPNLKCISRVGTGIDNIDQDFAKSRGIEIRNTPDAVVQPVLELVLAMIFDLLRKTTLHTSLIKSKKWEKHVGNLLYSKTVGILGTGRIGKRISEVLTMLGANVIAYDFFPDNKWANSNRVRYTSYKTLLKESDIISLHISPNGNKKPIICKKEINQMKSGVIIINTSRGQFIDENALFDGLSTKKIGGAGLDVYINEPYDGDLIKFDNVVLTPHVATLTKESRNEMETQATKNLLEVLI
jgi:D-3-phosphoglycerate dehydrogenase